MIKTVFETESLLAPNDEFLKYCETIVHYGIAERFYIFTCLNQVQSNNPKQFYRERALNTLMRLFYFLADLKEKIELKKFDQSINSETMSQLQLYLTSIMEILLNNLSPYQYISPQILLVVERSKQIIEILQEKEPSSESLVKSFKYKLKKIHEETYNEVNKAVQNAIYEFGQSIKEVSQSQNRSTLGDLEYMSTPSQIGSSLRKHKLSHYPSNIPLPPPQNAFKQFVSRNNSPFSIPIMNSELPRQTTANGRDIDQMTYIDNRTRIIANDKKNQLIFNKHNVTKDQELIEKQILADPDIDLVKIKKFFENVINEKHFLNNYGKAKALKEGGRAFDETELREAKKENIHIAKKYFQQGLRNDLQHDNLVEIRQKTRLCNLDSAQVFNHQQALLRHKLEPQSQDDLYLLRQSDLQIGNSILKSDENSIDEFINQNVTRQKSGVIKEHKMVGLYKSEQDEEKKVLEHISSEIMQLPIYQNSPFYPLKADLKKIYQERSDKQTEIEGVYGNIKQHFKEKLQELAESYQNKNNKQALKHFMLQFKEKDQTSEEDKTMSQDETMQKLPEKKKSIKKGKRKQIEFKEGGQVQSPSRGKNQNRDERSDESIFPFEKIEDILKINEKPVNQTLQNSSGFNQQYQKFNNSRSTQALDEPPANNVNNDSQQLYKSTQAHTQLRQALNLDQITILKNHDKINKSPGYGSNNRNQAYANQITAISGEAADRRPIKMKDLGVLKSYMNYATSI